MQPKFYIKRYYIFIQSFGHFTGNSSLYNFFYYYMHYI